MLLSLTEQYIQYKCTIRKYRLRRRVVIVYERTLIQYKCTVKTETAFDFEWLLSHTGNFHKIQMLNEKKNTLNLSNTNNQHKEIAFDVECLL